MNSLDVKIAFLQGKVMERVVYVRPPQEANTNTVWRLRKCIYDLADASRYWYLQLKEELVNLGATLLTLDQGIFLWFINEAMIVIMACFVDNVMWGGTDTFNSVIKHLRSTFCIGTENHQVFDYIGIHFEQKSDFIITVNQNSYTETILPIPISKEQRDNPHRSLTKEETTSLRASLGKLNWLAGMTRPEISFEVCQISTRVNNATVADILSVNKVIKFVKSTPSSISIPKLDLKSLSITVFADASFNNLPDGGSQGGYIIFLNNKYNSVVPLSWNSTRLPRVVRSTLAVETLAMSDACDSAIFLSNLTDELAKSPKQTNITVLTDNQSLFEALKTTKAALDHRLRVEISALREMCNNDEITINRVSSENQLSDPLTKRGTSHQKLMQALQSGRLPTR